MRRRLVVTATAAALAFAALGPTSASAATEFGDPCTANNSSEVPITYFALTAIGRPISLTAPVGGVVTKWKTNIIPTPLVIPQTLKVLRLTGPNSVMVTGEASANLIGGPNAIDTRIPIQAGDRLGLFGASGLGTLFCEAPGPEDTFGGSLGVSPGQTTEYVEVKDEAGIPVAAVIEPDADGDGFGDETQDQCPQVATVQGACPVVTVDATASKARKGSVTVLVTTTSQAPVTVSGTARLGKGKTAKVKGGTQTVTPGTIARFTLFFPKKLKEKLKDLSTKRSLKLSVAASATDLIGRITTDSLKVKLKGQEKPPAKKG